ncbi:hypothetical protein [Entomospira culicis]|uniref:Uncharacterized protein n=1 Tax=Entomospira culicis TaxID=2719989 RepID=A0A968GEY7_9SPIO|nr:hypothetical protein [Entomospira culicis]NIZ18573.1 hypothetical protein [Entomospira culicis]NIZ68788.1 hypothetical protein [Entomospira culicis]WDI37384.1 hypothetical protein PVA46_00935 [Entomospira culicis]WDI39013.1 hypothetical protein PVA47_00945 [Entomospira culicis]
MRIFSIAMLLLLLSSAVMAQSVLSDLFQIPLGSSTEALQRHARTHAWQEVLEAENELWKREPAIAFQAIRDAQGTANVRLLVYRVNWFNQSVDIYFFFHRNRLFAVNLFFPNAVSEEQFIALVQEVGGPKKDGYLGYGRPILQDSAKFLVYMWYLNTSFTHTLIMTYAGVGVQPSLSIQIMDENLGM